MLCSVITDLDLEFEFELCLEMLLRMELDPTKSSSGESSIEDSEWLPISFPYGTIEDSFLHFWFDLCFKRWRRRTTLLLIRLVLSSLVGLSSTLYGLLSLVNFHIDSFLSANLTFFLRGFDAVFFSNAFGHYIYETYGLYFLAI